MTTNSFPLTRIAARALPALLMIVCAAADGKAGCIHPSDGLDRLESVRLHFLEQAGALGAADDASPPRDAPAPCGGLRCSEAPAPPPFSTTPPAPRAEGWLHPAMRNARRDAGSALHPAAPAPLHPSHGAPAPFHPPR